MLPILAITSAIGAVQSIADSVLSAATNASPDPTAKPDAKAAPGGRPSFHDILAAHAPGGVRQAG